MKKKSSNIIIKHVMQYKVRIISLLILSILYTLCSIVSPYIIRTFINTITTSKVLLNQIYVIVLIFGTASFIGIFLSYFSNIIEVRLRNDVANHIINISVNQYYNASIDTYNKYKPDYLSQRIMGDSFKISSFLIGNVLRTVIIEVKAIVILSIIFSIKPMALVIFILSVPLYFFLLFLCKERLYKCNLAFKEQRDGYFSHLNELLYNMKTIKIHAIYPKLKSKFNNAYYDYLNGAIDLSKISYLFTNIETSLSTLLNIVIMLYSGIQIIKGHFLVGDIVLIIIYYNELLEILRFSIKQFESYQDYKVSFDRISEIIELDIVNDGDKYIEKIKNIRLDNISFSFDKNKIFDKFSFEFEKGKIYGIKGNNGIGKSTLINLILGLYSKYSGQIYFNDYNIKDINMKQAFFKKHSIRYLQELYLR